ncbi:MAG: hypothetical protein ACRCZF_13875 [Gemmataceae bacterium]
MNPTPQFATFVNDFPDPCDPLTARDCQAIALPEPYRTLLDHTHHMTVTVEQFYGRSVEVQVLACRQVGEQYRRMILLRLAGGGPVVQFGIVRVNLAVLPEPVRQEILSGRTPLGRVLIQHDVLRQVQPTGFVIVAPNQALQTWFGQHSSQTCYGRLGLITSGGEVAVEVLEILAPIIASVDDPCPGVAPEPAIPFLR